jgi:predicted nucleic acid-binding protein
MKCLDTYILVEISKGNPLFLTYLEKNIVIPEIVMAEFYGIILKEHNESTADYWLKKLRPYTKPASMDVLIEAIKFRREHKKRRISFFDAVGYCFAKEKKHVFVTGDKEFEKMKHVEFVKKMVC